MHIHAQPYIPKHTHAYPCKPVQTLVYPCTLAHTRPHLHMPMPMNDICDMCNMLKAKFKKMTPKMKNERKKEKVGVRICWMNQQINIITSSLIFLKAFTSSISCLINLFLFLLFALCLHWIIKQHKNYSTAKRNQKYSRLLLRKEITY